MVVWFLWLVVCLAIAREREQSRLLAALLCGCPLRRLLFWTASCEGEFGNPALIEMPEAHFLHFPILGKGGRREGKIELRLFRELQGDAAVFGRVIGAEKTGVIAIHHVFAVGDQNAAVGARLTENLHDRF